MTDKIKQLKRAARRAGLTVEKMGSHHYQIKGGPLLVNYYPHSKRSTAYVAQTKMGQTYVSPKEAVQMASKPPPFHKKVNRAQRSGPKVNKARKEKLFAKDPHCYWCKKAFPSIRQATIEHIIPIVRGGLDNVNNLTLACYRCNHERGHDMPELAK
jgi:hypothetical protein